MPKKRYNFLLPEEIASELEAYRSRTGISPTQFFTEAAIEKLGGFSQEQLCQKLEGIQKQIAGNGEVISELVEVLQALIKDGKNPAGEEEDDLQKKARDMIARLERKGGG